MPPRGVIPEAAEQSLPALGSKSFRHPGRSLDAVAEAVLIPAGALAASFAIFGAFLALIGADPFAVYVSIYRGAFESWFSWQNTLSRAAPLMLTALCTALPARLGLIVIGGEGALVVGAVATVAAATALTGTPSLLIMTFMMVAGMAAGALWIGAAGWLRHYRGVNETITTLILNYLAIAVMSQLVVGAMRDPTVVHRPSSWHVGDANMIGVASRNGCALGSCPGCLGLCAGVHPDEPHRVRLRGAHHRRECPGRPHGGHPRGTRHSYRLPLGGRGSWTCRSDRDCGCPRTSK
jgi:hypothetical protein